MSHPPYPPPQQPPRSSPPLKPQRPTGDLMSQGLHLLEACLSPRGAQGLVGIGLFCALVSALPLLQSLAVSLGGSALAWVLLLYSTGLWGGAQPLRHDFPWTSRSLLTLVLGAVPLNYLALASLDPALNINRWLFLPALALLPLMAWRSLRTLRPDHDDPLYVISLAGLGCCSAFLPGLSIPLMARGLDPGLLPLGFLSLSGGLLAYGLWRVLRQLWLHEQRHNLPESLLLSALLLYAWAAGTSLYALPGASFGLALLLPALMLTLISRRLRQVCRLMLGEAAPSSNWPSAWRKAVTGCEGLAATLAGCAALLGQEHYLLPGLSAGLLLWLTLMQTGLSVRTSVVQISFAFLSLASLGLSIYQVGQHQPADSAALVLAASALMLGLLARLGLHSELQVSKRFSSWNLGFHSQALLLTGASIWQISRFMDWSSLTTGALVCLTLYGVCAALWLGRSFAGYATVATGMMAAFSAVVLTEPLRSLDSWRWFALGLSFGMLAGGWLIERLSPGGQQLSLAVGTQTALSGRFSRLLRRELPDPYRFRQRFVSSVPYLFAEPLYNLALLMLTGAWLLNLGDLSFSLCAAMFYTIVFAIYPSRLWVYLVLLSLSDGLIGTVHQLLPGRYQSWGFVMVGMGWFFAGMLLEELLAARDRRHPAAEYEAQKQLVKPFFHAALAANALMLKHVFGEVQTAAGSESWDAAAAQAWPMLLTSGLYMLKLRVWVSRLWFYPGMLTVTMGLYFGLGRLLPLEGHLLLLTIAAWVWAGTGRLWQRSEALSSWWHELAEFRLGEQARDPHYFRAHLDKPESPFYILALLAGCVSLGFSLLLIPAQLLNWEQAVPLSFLTQSRPEWLDGFQVLNLGLLAALFGFALPGGPRARVVFDSGVMLSLSGALLWAGRNQLSLDTLPIGLLLLALSWQLLGLLGQRVLRPGLLRCLQVSSPVFALSGAAAMLLGTSALHDVIGLGLLAALCAVSLQQRAASWQVHVINVCWLTGLWLALALEPKLDSPPLLMIQLGLCLAGSVMLALSWRVPALARSLQGWSAAYLSITGLILLVIANVLLMPILQGYASLADPGSLNLLLTLSLPWLVLLVWQACYSQLLIPLVPSAILLISALGLLRQPWLAPLLMSLLGPALTQVLRLSDSSPWRRPLRVGLLASPILLQLPVLLAPPGLTPGLTALWQSLHLVAGSGLYAWLAFRQGAGQRRYLWGALLIAELAWEWAFWQGLGLHLDASAGALMLQVHATLMPLGLSFLLLAPHLVKRPAEQDQLTYLGLSLLLLMPLSLLAIKGSGLPKGLLLFELAAEVTLILLLALRWRRKALLYTGLSVGLCLAFGLSGGLLLYGSTWIRWAMFLGLGLSLAGFGLLIQQRQEWLRWLLNYWRSAQQSWR